MKAGKPRRGPSMHKKHMSLLGASGSRIRHVQIFGYGLGRPIWNCKLARPVTTINLAKLPRLQKPYYLDKLIGFPFAKVLLWLPKGLSLLPSPEAVDWPKVPAKQGTLNLLGERTFFFFTAVDLLRSRRKGCKSSKLDRALIKTSYTSFSTALTEGGSTTYSNVPFGPQVGKRTQNNRKKLQYLVLFSVNANVEKH